MPVHHLPAHPVPAAKSGLREIVLGLVCAAVLALGLLAALPSAAQAAPTAAAGVTAGAAIGSSEGLGAGSYRVDTRRVSGTGTPEIYGDAQVGEWLWADPGDWHRRYTDFEYQWVVDGDPVRGETTDEFEIGPRDVGAKIAVEVTGSGPRRAPVTVTSDVVGPVQPGILSVARSKLTGSARAGQTVGVKAGKVHGVRAKVAYQWTLNGKDVRRANAAKLRIPRAFRGDKLAVEVTYRASAYKTKTVTVSAGRVR